MKISTYWKAIVAAVTAGAGAVSTAAQDGVITGEEWTASAIGVLTALVATWAVPNKTIPQKETEA